MAIIVVSPLVVESDSGPSVEIVQLNITATPEDHEGLFNHVEVWRSTLGSAGPYYELTAPTYRAARVPESAEAESPSPPTGPSVIIVGEGLLLRIDEDDENEFAVTFTGVDPLTFAGCAAQVTAAGTGKVRAYVADDGTFVLESLKAGSGATLRVIETNGAGLLGLPSSDPDNIEGSNPDSFATGKEARIQLSVNVEQYVFSDYRGSDAFFYKTRFSNILTGGTSEFSRAFGVGSAPGISPSLLVCGQITLAGLSGKPARNVEVVVYNNFQGELVDDHFVAESQQSRLTDENGRAEFLLVRGLRCTVSITGTSIVRDIEVPTDPSVNVFDLLGADVSTNEDVFKVQVPDIITAERRSL
jgi:hypothetical protein